jgi:peptidoglycan hydrolase CwlO-like protein
MAKTSASPSRGILEAALQGLESQRQKLEEQISEVRRLLSGSGAASKSTKTAGKTVASSNSGRSPRKKRALSAEARARIAAAQKKRWAAFRKNQG